MSNNSLGGMIARAKREAKTADPETPHLIVEARAGTGKTFTLIIGVAAMLKRQGINRPWREVCRVMGREPVGSEQQIRVWDELAKGGIPSTITYLAFNNSIVRDFGDTYQWLVDCLEREKIVLNFQTVHSFGNKAVRKAYGNEAKLNKWKNRELMETELDIPVDTYRKNQRGRKFLKAVERLTSLCKLTLTVPSIANLEMMRMKFDIDCGDGQTDGIYEAVAGLIKLAPETVEGYGIDFDDMIWLPVIQNLPVNRCELLLGDEAQDWNRCQQTLIRTAGDRLIVCGDVRQAIYGWAGADVKSLQRLNGYLEDTDRGVKVLPLTVCRRCGLKIVEEAQQIVPDIEPMPDAHEGAVERLSYADARAAMVEGDMVLCRVNAPLVGLGFGLIRDGKKAVIKGQDIGKGLIRTIDKLRADTVPQLVEAAEAHCKQEIEKVRKLRNPDEEAIIRLRDTKECILIFCEDAESIEAVKLKIDQLFTDDTRGSVQLSSIHRAKGMEEKRVWILRPELLPHPAAKTPEQQEQEHNLRYVAITRAIEKLTYVMEDTPAPASRPWAE